MYSGIDLHSNNSVVAVIDDADRVVAQKRLPNDITKIVGFLARWQDQLAGVVVESTYNWYWLVDGLQTPAFRAPRQHGGDQAVRRTEAQRRRDRCAAPCAPAATGHPADRYDLAEGAPSSARPGAQAHATGAVMHDTRPRGREHHGPAARRADDQQSDQAADRRHDRQPATGGGCRLGNQGQRCCYRDTAVTDRGSGEAPARTRQAPNAIRLVHHRAGHRPALATVIFLETGPIDRFAESATLRPMRAASTACTPAIARRRAKATSRTATNISPGHSSRRRISPGAFVPRPSVSTSARRPRPTTSSPPSVGTQAGARLLPYPKGGQAV